MEGSYEGYVDCDWRHRIQKSSTADMDEESATSRRRNPTFLKMRCTVKLSRNISAETLPSFSSRAIWTVRRSNSIPRGAGPPLRVVSMDDHNLKLPHPCVFRKGGHHESVSRGILGVRIVSWAMFLEP
jgi:hypothetical protein